MPAVGEPIKTNLLEYIGAEETNLLVSINLCRRDMDAFPNLDGLFQAPIHKIDLKVKDQKNLSDAERHKMTVLALYLYVHYHLYSTMTNILRCHLSDAFSQTRKAIDATLTVCRLVRQPETLNQYLERHGSYLNIKRFIEGENKKPETAYADTEGVLNFHEICSQYGSHADASSFVHRAEITEPNELGKSLFRLHMFQKPDSDFEFRYYVIQLIFIYAQMLWLMRDFVGGQAEKFDKEDWVKAIHGFGKAVEKEMIEVEKKINGAHGAKKKADA